MAEHELPTEPDAPTAGGQPTRAERRAVIEAARGARRATGIAVRAVGGAAAAAATAALVLGASGIDLPASRAVAAEVVVEPSSGVQTAVCPGPLLDLASFGDDDGAVTSVGTPIVTSQASGDITTTPISTEGITTGESSASALSAAVGSDGMLAAAQSQQVAADTLTGFAASTCAPASSSQWLVGGATTVGRTTLVVLTNPSEVAATVDVRVWTEQGPVEAPGATGLNVPAGSQFVVPVAGYAPDAASPVLEVVSTGGRVTAVLQQTTVRGLEAGGVDVVNATAAPALTQVVPAVRVLGAEATGAASAQASTADLVPVLRLLAPGEQPASVAVSVTPLDGGTGAVLDTELPAGTSGDVPLDGLVDGTYSLRVTSDVPVVAAVRTSTVDDDGVTDFAWAEAANVLGPTALAPVAEGPDPRLVVANAGASTASYRLGSGQLVTLAPGESRATSVTPGQTYPLEATGDVAAAVSYADTGALATYALVPRALAVDAVTVLP